MTPPAQLKCLNAIRNWFYDKRRKFVTSKSQVSSYIYYNLKLHIVIGQELEDLFQPGLNLSWDGWKQLMGQFDVFCTNLLVEVGAIETTEKTMSLKDFYPGAIGNEMTLHMQQKFELWCITLNQIRQCFPLSVPYIIQNQR
ncbi:4479_t:CDS:1 [Paraglomus brasilianum]|uniref:4479_t:CDS:1 n=1 Tax=Paraglomus brasilianum TaxID=144538 RepID=A0A9N9GX57_9GLOM|nr:4479_t:CDS:1 [Paraglomus brasilianum]